MLLAWGVSQSQGLWHGTPFYSLTHPPTKHQVSIYEQHGSLGVSDSLGAEMCVV